MAVRPVVLAPAPVLATVCAPVTRFDGALAELAMDLLQSLYPAYGRGLAAPQIDVAKRVFVVDTTWKEGTPTPMVFVNPEIIDHSDETATATEQCLSIPDTPIEVTRPIWIDLRWQSLSGAYQDARFDGFAASCIQHGRDHLDGVLITDKSTR